MAEFVIPPLRDEEDEKPDFVIPPISDSPGIVIPPIKRPVQNLNAPNEPSTTDFPILPTLSEFLNEVGKGADISFKRIINMLTPEFEEGDELQFQPPITSGILPGDPQFPPPLIATPEMVEERRRMNVELEEEVGEPSESIGGAFARDISRFMTFYIPTAILMSRGGAGAITTGIFGGAAAEIAAFPPDVPRISNMLSDLDQPVVTKAVLDFIKADPGDSKAVGLLKQATEGVIIGGVAESIARSIAKVVRYAISIKRGLSSKTVGVSPDTQASPRSGIAELDVAADEAANDLLRGPFTLADLAEVRPAEKGLSVAEARVEALTARYRERLEALNTEGKLTNLDIEAKLEVFRKQANRRITPPKSSIERGRAVRNSYSANQAAVRESRKISGSKVAVAVRDFLAKQIWDRTGNIKRELRNNAGDLGETAAMRLDLTAGASVKAAEHLHRARVAIFGGLKSNELDQLDELILMRRLMAIKSSVPSYKPPIGVIKGTKGKTVAKDYSEALQLLRQEIGEANYAKLSGRADAFFEKMTGVLDVLYEGGVISAAERVKLSRFDYTPIRYIEEIDPSIATVMVGGKPNSIASSGIRKLGKGKEQEILNDPQMFLGEIVSRGYSRALRNRANQALYQVAEEVPDNGVVSLKRPKKGEHIEVSVMFDGKKRDMFIREDLADQWNVSPIHMSNWIRLASGSLFVRPLATGINPEFALSNFPRDLMFGWLTAGEGSLYSAAFPKAFAQLTNDLIETAGDAFNRTGTFNDFIDEGGGMVLLTHEGQFGRTTTGRGAVKGLKRDLVGLQHYAGYINETSEIWVRLAIRNRALKRIRKEKGFITKEDQELATWEARRYLDFYQGGGAIKRLDAVMPYLNAGVQGMRGFTRAAAADPTAMSFKLAQLMSIFGGIWLANDSVNKEGFTDVPPQVRNNNIVIMTNDFYIDDDGNKRNIYFKLPIDHTVMPLKTIVDALMDRSINGTIPDDTTMNVMKQFGGLVPGADRIPAVAAWTAVVGNFDFWRNEQIWKGSQKLPPEGEVRRTGERPTSALAEDVAGMLASVVRDTPLEGLGSPERLAVASRAILPKNIYTDLVGGSYEAMVRGIPDEVLAMRGEIVKQNLNEFPFVRRLVGITHPRSSTQAEIKDSEQQAAVEVKNITDELRVMFDTFTEEQGITRNQTKIVENFIGSQDPVHHDTLKRRFLDMQKIDQVFRAVDVNEVPTVPPRPWWVSLSGANAVARSYSFVDHWLDAELDTGSDDPIKRRWGERKKRMMRQLSRVVPGFNPNKSKKYGLALRREFRQRGLDLPHDLF